MSEYIPSTREWVRDQVELYEGSGGTEGLTLRETGLPVIIVTNKGRRTGGIRKTPLMKVVDGKSYILVGSQGGAPKHPRWYHNLKADPNVEIRDETEVYSMRARDRRPGREAAALGYRRKSISSLPGVPRQDRPGHPGFLGGTLLTIGSPSPDESNRAGNQSTRKVGSRYCSGPDLIPYLADRDGPARNDALGILH